MSRNTDIDSYLQELWLRNSALASHGLELPTRQPETTYTAGGKLIETVLTHAKRQQRVLDAYANSLDQDAVPPATSRLSIPLAYPGNTLPGECHIGYEPHYELTIGPDEKLRYMRETIGEAMSRRCSSTLGGYFHYSLRDKEDGLINSLIAFGKGNFTWANDCTFGYDENPITVKRSFVVRSKHPDLQGNYYSVYLVDYEKPEEEWTPESPA